MNDEDTALLGGKSAETSYRCGWFNALKMAKKTSVFIRNGGEFRLLAKDGKKDNPRSCKCHFKSQIN
jgi:hypothetical protein